ncbi:hypothetical protein [Nocardia australiensis]|uniref:hypothetical protein n=1 Tax=Nocardia australiensis TaxID=2887191 RepID=UPI001D13DE64|nr:hypothetical protein [Nocardia australiensis]
MFEGILVTHIDLVPNLHGEDLMPATAPKSSIIDRPYVPLQKRPLPAGRPRKWYVTHNRRLKAMRLTIALLDSGIYLPRQASNERIRRTAVQIDIRPPSDMTCRLVRTLMRYSR